jgi:hexosaminidase
MKPTTITILAIFLAIVLLSLSFFSVFSCGGSGRSPSASFPAAADIHVSWEVVENVFKGHDAFLSRFTLTNRGAVPLDKKDWAFYFNFIRAVVPDEMVRKVAPGSVPETVTITHVNGDLYKMTPTEKFPVLNRGQSVSIAFVSSNWAINYTDAPAGGYFVYTAEDGAPLPPQPVKEIEVKPFIHERQTRRNANDRMPVSTPQLRYKENQTLQKSAKENLPGIVPSPVRMEARDGSLVLTAGFEIRYSAGLEKEAAFLNRVLEKVLGRPLTLLEAAGGTKGPNLILLTHETIEEMGVEGEAYTLSIHEQEGIRIAAKNPRGVFYGIRSLQALLPVEVFARPRQEIKLPAVEIDDKPRFAYRGMHLDVARNFQDKEAVKKLLDLMSFYKLNTFHFHITDDEGWRLEIPRLPELTQVGAYRGHTLDDRDDSDCLAPSFGSGPEKDPSVSHGSGFYSRADFIEILAYAHERKIEVIPEIDVPGHARAAVKAMDARFRRLMKEGKTKEAEEFLLRDLNDQSTYLSVQRWNDNTLCVCRESVYRFLEVVVDDIRGMYKEAGAPLTTIHTGGDEVPRGVWEKSPLCLDFIKQQKDISGAGDLAAYFIRRFNRILKSRGLVTGGWQEIALTHAESENAPPVPNPEFIGQQVQPYCWNNVWGWGLEDVGQRLANAGYPVVIAYVTNLYFDLAYAKDPAEPGYYWGGFINARKAYELTPFDIRKCASTDLLGNPLDKEKFFKKVQSLTPEGRGNIRGIQGLLWAENAKGPAAMEYLMFPKLLGLAERAWAAQPEWARIPDDTKREAALNRAWNHFAHLLGGRELPRLDHLSGGVNYRIPPAGAVLEDGLLKANTAFPGLTIRYTLDGGDPDPSSPRYDGPVAVGNDVKVIKLKVFNGINRSSRTTELEPFFPNKN